MKKSNHSFKHNKSLDIGEWPGNGLLWAVVVDDHLLAKLLNSHPAWHFLTGLESELLGWHCRWCGKWLFLGKLESEVRRSLRSILQLVLLQLWINKNNGFLRPWTCAANQNHMFCEMHLLSSDTVSEYHSSPIPCTTESGSLWWPGRMHSCQVLLPCRWWAWEKLFLYRSLIGIFESLLGFTKISVEVYSNVMRCVSTIKCLFNSLHQPSSAKIPSKATPFFGFPPLHSRGFCCDRVYALAFLLQRLDDHKLMIELGLEPQNLWTKFPAIYVFGMVNQKPWYLSFGIFVVKVDLDFWTHLAPLGSCPLRFDGTPHGSQGSNLMCLRSVEKSRQLQLLLDLEKQPVFL